MYVKTTLLTSKIIIVIRGSLPVYPILLLFIGLRLYTPLFHEIGQLLTCKEFILPPDYRGIHQNITAEAIRKL